MAEGHQPTTAAGGLPPLIDKIVLQGLYAELTSCLQIFLLPWGSEQPAVAEGASSETSTSYAAG